MPPACCRQPGQSFAQGVTGVPAAAGDYQAKADQYARARRAFEEEADAYWQSIVEKRRVRIAKRRNNEPIGLDDYVLTQPPVYQGPPRPVDPAAPDKDPTEPRKPDIPVVADFLKAAAEQFRFVPERPESEIAFKRAYVKVASAAGLTKDQVVRIYGFETGGNGTYDVQAGLTHPQAGRAGDLAGHRVQSASEHQQRLADGGARRPIHQALSGNSGAADRRCEKGDGAEDRSGPAHGRVQPDGAEPLERA